MTHRERLRSLQVASRMLVDDGVLCIIEAPNRLWPFDSHTADLPFFHWLPDELRWSTSSKRGTTKRRRSIPRLRKRNSNSVATAEA